MSHKNIEFKARATNLLQQEKKLQSLYPKFIGEDHQVDTYYNTPYGRLKLREGSIENALIHYERENIAGSKLSTVILYNHTPNDALKQILQKTLGIKIIVDKKRKIYFIDNVKFHFDTVKNLGAFIEVEAIDYDGDKSMGYLQKQCDEYARLLQINEDQFESYSYSDLLLNRQK